MVRESTLVMFNEHSAGAIVAKRSLHEGFLKKPRRSMRRGESNRGVSHHARLYHPEKVKLLQRWQAQRAPPRLLSQLLLGFLACCYKFETHL